LKGGGLDFSWDMGAEAIAFIQMLPLMALRSGDVASDADKSLLFFAPPPD